jgi:LPS-assembly lipoprotein
VRELRQTLENSGVKIYTGAPYKLVLVDEQDTQRNLQLRQCRPLFEYEIEQRAVLRDPGPRPVAAAQRQAEVHKVVPA